MSEHKFEDFKVCTKVSHPLNGYGVVLQANDHLLVLFGTSVAKGCTYTYTVAFLNREDQPDISNWKLLRIVDDEEFHKNKHNSDPVNKPAHYNAYCVEVADLNDSILETITNPTYAAYFKTMSEYLLRAHLKNGIQDLEKLNWWLSRCIKMQREGKLEIK